MMEKSIYTGDILNIYITNNFLDYERELKYFSLY